jgi:very-short-patch-repair endonuclease
MAVDLARQQHGLLTRRQASELQISDRMIATRVRDGRWRVVRPGIYVVGGVPPTWEQRTLAAVLAAGPDALASHRTAARLWGLVQRSGRVEVLIPHERRVELADVHVHRSRRLVEADATVRAGVPVTSLDRTITDLATRHPERVVGRWIDAGLRDHGLDLARLAATCGRLTFPGHPPPRSAMRALILRTPGYDPGRSALESRALEAIERERLPSPVRQHPVRRPTGERAYIDLSYPWAMLALELDGWETHGVRSAFDDDRIRANDLVLLGWTVLRFTWAMSDAYLCSTIRSALAAAGQRS